MAMKFHRHMALGGSGYKSRVEKALGSLSLPEDPPSDDDAFTLDCCSAWRLPVCHLQAVQVRQTLGGAKGEA